MKCAVIAIAGKLSLTDVVSLAGNVFGLGEVGDFENQMFNLAMKFNSSTKVKLTHFCPNFGNAMLGVVFFGFTFIFVYL